MTLAQLREEVRVPVVLADHPGFVKNVNARFEEVFGWSRAEIVGKPITVLIPAVLQDAHHMGFSRFLMTGQGKLLGRPLKLTAVTRLGTELAIELTLVAEQRGGEWTFGATLRPLGEGPLQAKAHDGQRR
jgi:PAS domain S-box-containing protein